MIEAKNMGNLSRASNTVTRGLNSELFLCVNIGTMMKSIILKCHGLCNGATCGVCDIVYKSNDLAPELTKYVWGDLNYQYK